MNFEEASDECVTAGGQLAYPSDDAENQAIMDYLSNHFDGDLSSGPNLVNPLSMWRFSYFRMLTFK